MESKVVKLNTDLICKIRSLKYLFLKEVTLKYKRLTQKSRVTHPGQEYMLILIKEAFQVNQITFHLLLFKKSRATHPCHKNIFMHLKLSK